MIEQHIIEITSKQRIICERYAAAYMEASFDKIIGVAIETFEDKSRMPIHGLRRANEPAHTTGWYIWAGDFSEADDFFKPVHVHHLLKLYPQVLDYLGLAQGWRFIIDDQQYEDVWYDEWLLNH